MISSFMQVVLAQPFWTCTDKLLADNFCKIKSQEEQGSNNELKTKNTKLTPSTKKQVNCITTRPVIYKLQLMHISQFHYIFDQVNSTLN